ncbi:hypothetical protein ACHAQH_008217 [Verticillium albo-atrum]
MASVYLPTEGLMNALVYDKLTKTIIIKKVPVPIPTGPKEHLVQVHAVAITNGELAWAEPLQFDEPIPGFEVAGVVVHAPADSVFQPGSEVYARTHFERQGSARPFTIITTAELSLKPKNLSWEEAATVPLSALTAWQALFVHGRLRAPTPGDQGASQRDNAQKRVLVTAAAGGVGIFLVQLARLAGAQVVGTCGQANIDFVSELGAQEVLDYRTTDLGEWVKEDPESRKFDLAIDCVGTTTLRQAWRAARPGGRLISIVEEPRKEKPEQGVEDGVSSLFFIVEASSEQLGRVTELVEAGSLRAFVDSVFDLQDGAKAFEKVDGRRLRGKVVIRVQ